MCMWRRGRAVKSFLGRGGGLRRVGVEGKASKFDTLEREGRASSTLRRAHIARVPEKASINSSCSERVDVISGHGFQSNSALACALPCSSGLQSGGCA